MNTFEVSPSIKEKIIFFCFKGNFSKVFDLINYNIKGGKLTRYDIFAHICDNAEFSNIQDLKLLIGFCLEAFHASFIISDDIVDNSTLRRNLPCYYLKRKMMTLRDSKFLISLIYNLLKDSPCKSVFEKSFYDTCLGQTLDTKKKYREDYTFELYKKICELKTSSYTVYLPLVCGYKLINKKIPLYLEDFTNILGLIYQSNDDYLDFFPGKRNKTSNDLEEYKLTYFTVKLNEICTNDSCNIYFRHEGVPEYIKKWIFDYFPSYLIEKDILVKKSREMINQEDEKGLLFLYDILKRYETN